MTENEAKEKVIDRLYPGKYAICCTRWLRTGGTATVWFTGEHTIGIPTFLSDPNCRMTMSYEDAQSELESGWWPYDVEALPVP